MERIIWTMWWQGEKNAPPLVKACFESMKQHSGTAEVRILDEGNYRDFVTLPEYIIDKFEQKQITLTHLSDIIRMQLLYRYGGLWVDSTVFMTGDIPEDVFTKTFYTVSYYGQYKWTGFLIGGEKGGIVFREQNRLLLQYWKTENILIEYLLIDYFMEMLYSHNRQIKELIDAVPQEHIDILRLGTMLNEEYDSRLYEGIFHKLNWKISYQTDTSAETNYQHILKQYGVSYDGLAGKKEQVIIRKGKSFLRHIRNHLNRNRIHRFGWKICLLSFASACVRTMENSIAFRIKEKYRMEVLRYLEERYGQWLV